MAIFGHKKIRPKLKKNLTDSIFGVKVSIIHMHLHAKFGVDPLNDVQNFHQKLKIVPRQTDGQTDRQTDVRRTPRDGNSHLVRWTKVAKKLSHEQPGGA